MALEEGFSEGGTSSFRDSNNQVPLAIPQRGFECPICLDNIEDETSVSWCRHAFCFPCIVAWACFSPVCPICQEPFKYLFRKVGDMNYEVYFTRSTRRNRGRRAHRHSADRRWRDSTGHQQHRSSRGQHGNGQARDQERNRSRDRERDRGRSRRRNRDGHRRDQQARGYHPSSSRRWQHSRAHGRASETSSGWDQAARHEGVPVHSVRSEHRQRTQQVSSRELRTTRRRTRRRPHSTWRQTQREGQRRMDHDEGQPARPEGDVPDSSGRSGHR